MAFQAVDLNDLRSIEELQNYEKEVRGRLTEVDAEFAGLPFPDEVQEEYAELRGLNDEIGQRLVELDARQRYIERLGENPRNSERSFDERDQRGRKEQARDRDIFDLTTIRATWSQPDKIRDELHDRAKRAIEIAVFPDERISRERAQGHIERLLERDSPDGEIARRILMTGSPSYRRTFSRYMRGQPLSQEEQRAAFALGSTGLPVPYVLDPTVLPVSASVVNPLRAIASVEQITVNEWRGLTAAAITASRQSEATEATDNTPVLAQPTIVCSKAHCFVPFSIESGQDWVGMEATVSRLIADAKDDEEATAFMNGNGTPPNPFGLLTGATGTTAAATGLTVTAANLYSLEGALAPRFRPRAQFVANRAIYNIIRALDTAGGAQLWLRIGELIPNNPRSDGGLGNTGLRLLGYPVNELSTMSATVVNTTKIMVLGDFSYFKIIDRIGLNIELLPLLVGGTANYPTGQRGFYAYWRNGSKVVDAVAFRALTGTT
jgi:HK97 family phage major capsid protein